MPYPQNRGDCQNFPCLLAKFLPKWGYGQKSKQLERKKMNLAGRAEAEIEFAVVRELEDADILVRGASPIGSKPPEIKALRATHHKLAQVLAQGFADAEAAIATGYSLSRISILKSDPTFKELLSFYESERREVFVDVQQRMAGFATTAVEVLQERLEEKPEAFSNKDLNELIKTTADRGGHSPVQKSENKTIILDARQLAALKEEVEAKQSGQVRKINQAEEATRVKTYLEGKNNSGNSGDTIPEISANDNATVSVSGAATTTGGEGEGDNI